MGKLTGRGGRREAQFLRDAVVGGDVPASLKLESDGGYSIWVHAQADMPMAEELLGAFVADPRDPRIADLAGRAGLTPPTRAADERGAHPRTEAPEAGSVAVSMRR